MQCQGRVPQAGTEVASGHFAVGRTAPAAARSSLQGAAPKLQRTALEVRHPMRTAVCRVPWRGVQIPGAAMLLLCWLLAAGSAADCFVSASPRRGGGLSPTCRRPQAHIQHTAHSRAGGGGVGAKTRSTNPGGLPRGSTSISPPLLGTPQASPCPPTPDTRSPQRHACAGLPPAGARQQADLSVYWWAHSTAAHREVCLKAGLLLQLHSEATYACLSAALCIEAPSYPLWCVSTTYVSAPSTVVVVVARHAHGRDLHSCTHW